MLDLTLALMLALTLALMGALVTINTRIRASTKVTTVASIQLMKNGKSSKSG
jgi:hypothetical protein